MEAAAGRRVMVFRRRDLRHRHHRHYLGFSACICRSDVLPVIINVEQSCTRRRHVVSSVRLTPPKSSTPAGGLPVAPSTASRLLSSACISLRIRSQQSVLPVEYFISTRKASVFKIILYSFLSRMSTYGKRSTDYSEKSRPSVVRGGETRVVLFCCILCRLLFLGYV